MDEQDTGAGRWRELPRRLDPDDLVVEIPAFEDDRPAPPPAPPAAAPELVAATQFANASARRSGMRRSGIRIGLIVGGIPLLIAFGLAFAGLWAP